MKIELHLPRSFDASVEYNQETRVIEIEPAPGIGGTLPLLGVRVLSADGKRETRSMISFNLVTGQPSVSSKPTRAVQTFDSPPADQAPKPPEPPKPESKDKPSAPPAS